MVCFTTWISLRTNFLVNISLTTLYSLYILTLYLCVCLVCLKTEEKVVIFNFLINFAIEHWQVWSVGNRKIYKKYVKSFFPLFSADARIGVHCLQCATWRIRSLASAVLALCVLMAYTLPSYHDNLPHFTCTAFSFSGHYHKVHCYHFNKPCMACFCCSFLFLFLTLKRCWVLTVWNEIKAHKRLIIK